MRQIPISITGSAIIDSKSESGLERNTEREKLKKNWKANKICTDADFYLSVYNNNSKIRHHMTHPMSSILKPFVLIYSQQGLMTEMLPCVCKHFYSITDTLSVP